MKKLLAALLLLLPSIAFGQSVQQSGTITPGHAVQWITNGIIGDGGVPGGPIFTGSTTVNDFACVGASGTIIDCGLSATGTNAWTGLQNFNGGATVPTQSFGNNSFNVADTAFVQAAVSGLLPGLCTTSGAFPIYNATSAAWVCSTAGGTGSLGIINGTFTAGTSAVARSLNVGSNFVAAQPAEFNVNDNQAPADSRLCYFGVLIPGGTSNAGFINASCGTSGNPVNWAAGSTSFFGATYDTGGAGRSYNGEWHNYTVSAGTGGTTQSQLVYCTLGGTWTPSGAAGCVGNALYANTTVGGFTWGSVPAAAASGATAANIVSIEADTQYAAGAGGNKVGIQIVDQLNNATGTSTIAAVNTAFQVICVTSAYCWDTGILFPAATGSTGFGVRTTGTLIKSAAGTFTHGIDISAGTCSTDCWKSNGSLIDGSGNITGLTYKVGANQVVGARITGYTAMTGTPDKATSYATSTITLAQLAGRMMQLQADLTTHGLIGP